MMKTKNARRRPMTRTPTRPSSSGVAAFAAPGRAFESRQSGTWTRRISHGYRERKTAASRARLPRRTAEATCCLSCVAPRGFFFFFLFRLRRVTMRSRLLRAGFAEHSFFKAALFFRRPTEAERERASFHRGRLRSCLLRRTRSSMGSTFSGRWQCPTRRGLT